MKSFLKTLGILLIAVSFSCSSDSDNIIINESSLTQTIVYLPQSSNFDNKLVTNYVNNRKVNDINYDGSGAITQRTEFTYGLSTSTALVYDALGVYLYKRVYNYDSLNRISTIENYNSSDQLTGSREYVYEGTDINVFATETGVPTLIFKYKINSDNLIYYEKNMNSMGEQTFNYASLVPEQLILGGVFLLSYEFYPVIKPLAIQNDAIEINNEALISLSIQTIKYSCNYYLKKEIFQVNPNTTFYEREFNADNYETYVRTTISNPSEGTILSSEKFLYYE